MITETLASPYVVFSPPNSLSQSQSQSSKSKSSSTFGKISHDSSKNSHKSSSKSASHKSSSHKSVSKSKGYVKFPSQKRQVSKSSNHQSTLKSSSNKAASSGGTSDDSDGAVSFDMSHADAMYTLNLTIGSNNQPITLQIDTGSSDMWVINANNSWCSETSQGKGEYSTGKDNLDSGDYDDESDDESGYSHDCSLC
ncbi:unnamed protein product [Ambrosiozyma monospora]|uniref:Unnamed protein product n=1 Tax=Ambrosiozyma monospora TaxID=43982 RepID=A0ACB5UB45_AMBMO|nr:unnamed protein product [Ambrosiozyma monospora]